MRIPYTISASISTCILATVYHTFGSLSSALFVYHDAHTIFKPPKGEPQTIAEQLEGRRRTTQFGRLLEELQIGSVTALRQGPGPESEPCDLGPALRIRLHCHH